MYESLSESKVQGEKACLVGVSLDTYTRSTVSFGCRASSSLTTHFGIYCHKVVSGNHISAKTH